MNARIISFGLLLVAASALAWECQFKYAMAIHIENDRFIGMSAQGLNRRLGEPDEAVENARRRGYEIEPAEPFNKVLIYKPLYGQLDIYLNNDVAVSSVFHSPTTKF